MASDDKKFEYIQERLDTVIDKVHEINSSLGAHSANFAAHIKQDEGMHEELKRSNDILAENTESLKTHMHRTALLEDYLKKVDQRFTPIELEHIKRQAVKENNIAMLKLVAKIGGAVGAISTIGVAAKFVLENLL